MFRPIKIRQYVSFMESRGFSAEKTLAGSGVVQSRLMDPGYLVEFEHHQSVVTNMIHLTGKQGIGLEVGRESDIADYGVVGHAMMSSSTVFDAVNLWLRYSNALIGLLIGLRLEQHTKADWSLTITELQPMGFLYNFATEEFLTMALKLGEMLCRAPMSVRELELTYPAPDHKNLYARYFGCEPSFNSRRTRIQFDTPPLATPLKGRDDEFNVICLRQCDHIFKQMSSTSPILSKVKTILSTRMSGIPSFDEVADQLAISPRSLRRRLQSEGYTFLSLVKQARLEAVHAYLAEPGMSIKEAGLLLGYKDTDAFRQAFKTWTGRTIQEYRQEFEKVHSGAPGEIRATD